MASAYETYEIDQQIAAHDFLELLCLVKTDVPYASASAEAAAVASCVGNEVASLKLWPALKFNSFKELMDRVNLVAKDSKSLRAKLTIGYHRSLREAKIDAKSCGVAYLLGRGCVTQCVVLVSRDENMNLMDVFDFFNYVEEMEQGEGYCGNAEFQRAYKTAILLLETSVDIKAIDGTGNMNAFTEKSKNCDVDVADRKCESDPSTKAPAKTFKSVELAAKVPSSQLSLVVSEKKRGRPPSNRQQSPKSQVTQKAKTHEQPLGGVFLKKVSDHNVADHYGSDMIVEETPVETVIVSRRNGSESISSPEKPSLSDEEDASEQGTSYASESSSRKQRTSPAKSLGMTWARMWRQMKIDGWGYTKGDTLVGWYYVHPTCAHMKKTELLRLGKEGEDYFTSEEAVMKYAMVNLGWNGDVESSQSFSVVDMAERVKKRSAKRKQRESAEQSIKMAATETVKKGKTKHPKQQEVAKVVKKAKTSQPSPSTPGETSATSIMSEVSRFSDGERQLGSVCQRTRNK